MSSYVPYGKLDIVIVNGPVGGLYVRWGVNNRGQKVSKFLKGRYDIPIENWKKQDHMVQLFASERGKNWAIGLSNRYGAVRYHIQGCKKVE